MYIFATIEITKIQYIIQVKSKAGSASYFGFTFHSHKKTDLQKGTSDEAPEDGVPQHWGNYLKGSALNDASRKELVLW